MNELIFFNPIFKTTVWGGNKLETEFGFVIPSDHTGESWVISAHRNGDCPVKKGSFEGKALSWLWKNHWELFGEKSVTEFPLLIKIIDAKDDLSIQVHPDDAYAMKYENGSYGKTECWYILDCEDEAEIVIGHNANDKSELKSMIDNSEWKNLIRTRKIKKGDFFQIEPGTLHAIKKGTMILEIQQNSDITYRVYDYDRLDKGKTRELHLEKSLAVITCPQSHTKNTMKEFFSESCEITEMINCDKYVVKRISIHGRKEFLAESMFCNVCVIEGSGYINDQKLTKGDAFIIPLNYGSYALEGDMQLIISSAGTMV